MSRRHTGRAAAPFLVLFAVAACDSATPVADGGREDGGATDAATRDSGPRDGGGRDSGARDAGDPCVGVSTCTAEGTECAGDTLVTCAPDAMGCLIETTTDCAAMGMICDPGLVAACAAPPDPCAGVDPSLLCTTPGSTCMGDTLETCAPDDMGCLVTTSIDCTATSERCRDVMGTNTCVDPCTLVTTCPMPTYCDGADVVTCTADADGCLVESSRSTCAGGCTGGRCVANCAGAAATVLSCASGTVMGDTAMGTMSLDQYAGCTPSTNYGGREQFWIFRDTGGRNAVRIQAMSASTDDFDMFVLDGADGTASCSSGLTCVDGSTGFSADETVNFVAAPDRVYYVSYDRFGAGGDAMYTLTVSCTAVVCGDGVLTGDENCEDGNTTAGDGCSDICRSEPGWRCTGTPSMCTRTCGNGMVEGTSMEQCDDGNLTTGDGCSDSCQVEAGFNCFGAPSMCVPRAPNAECSGAIALGGTGTRMGDNLRTGGARPMGTGCGFSSGPVLWYEVTIPPNSEVTFRATPTGSAWDLTLRLIESCAATTCISNVDAAAAGMAETTLARNTTSMPITRLVAVGADSSTTFGTFDVVVSTAPLPFVPITAMCVDMSTGTVVPGVDGDDRASTIMPLPFGFTLLGDAVSHYSVTSNGFMQLWPSATGTPSTTFTNANIPLVGLPNGFVAPFWDDLDTIVGGMTDARTLVTGAAPNRRFVVQWTNWRIRSRLGTSVTFQAHLVEGSNEIELHYCAMMPGASGMEHTGSGATIGIESLDGMTGRLVSFNTAGAVMTGSGFRILP